MKLADYAVDFLGRNGIDKVCMVYGSAMGDLCDAFTRTKQTEYISVIHEQGGGFAAECYAKISGKPGAVIVTSGPGGMNLVTPIGNCFYDSVPCIFITGQINSRFLRPDPSVRQVGFQETDIVSIVKPITKYAVMVTDPRAIRYEMEKAYWLCRNERPGPVLIDLPMDVQKAEIDPGKLHGFDASVEAAFYDMLEVRRVAFRLLDDLQRASRPVILVGGGVRIAGAVSVINELSQRLGVPCFPTWNALDVITSDLDFYGGRIGTYGGAGRNFAVQNSDLLVAIGCRLSGRITGGNIQSFARGAKKYVIDVDPALLQRYLQQLPFDVCARCDAYIFLKCLLDIVVGGQDPRLDIDPWRRQVVEWRDRYDPVQAQQFLQSSIHPYAFVRQLSELMASSDVLVADCGGNIVVCNHAFKTKFGQRYLTNNGNSPMGFSMCGAMGAWFADPARRVVCVIGDGGFQMNIQELQTIKHYNVPLKIFVLNNHTYGITVAYQETNFGGKREACGPKGYSVPNFLEIARAYGLSTRTVSKTRDADRVISEVLNSREAVVCDVDCGDFHQYEPRMMRWDAGIEEQWPSLPENEFLGNMIIDPVPGWQDRRSE